MKKVVFIAKTDLNTDGRILNELRILENSKLDIKVDFILLPDKPLKVNPGKNVTMHIVTTIFRHNKYLRFFTNLEFIVKSLILLFKLKPEILHAQDTEIIQPVLIYRFLKGANFKLIYDDHEIPNENADLFYRIYHSLEVLLMKKADNIIFANKERLQVLKERHSLENSCIYFLNLPYFENDFISDNETQEAELDALDKEISLGSKFIIHQGPLAIERGREKLAIFSKILPRDFKVLLLGGNRMDYLTFIEEYKLNKDKFHFRGSVNYMILPKYWERGVASIVMYLPTYLNNRLCAPNRFYISLQKGLPVIVNKENPVLSNFVNQYNCGVFIEDLNEQNIATSIENVNIKSDVFKQLKEEQIDNFTKIYR
ncbi:MAG TPA: hypothetical protein VFC65_20560 [Prolixibacteraceae bacterium]|nr:hypothetical protein [Prolixibacteraceae bacterium]